MSWGLSRRAVPHLAEPCPPGCPVPHLAGFSPAAPCCSVALLPIVLLHN